uniref:Uncharacterized protein n=1 Tax=Schizaphis graminum TaxID=13262 RepID=A0A2S2P1N1_SCHGA
MISLLDRENLDFKSDLRILSLELTVLRIYLMCQLQVSRLSRIRPRYFTSFAVGIIKLFSVTGGVSKFLNVKVTWTDLVSFILIFHLFAHRLIIFKWFWIISLAIT